MAWLDDHEPVRDQFRCPRRAPVTGLVVVHTAENTPDFVAFDGGAEAVARFIQTRTTPGSYHDLVDSDSIINLVRYECEAYQDGTGSNPYAYAVSAATRADVWPLAPKAWRDGCVRNMARGAARYARWCKATRGITIPPRRVTRAQSSAGAAGFISHAERDPARREDPGLTFPWAQFLAEYAALMGTNAGGGPLADLTDAEQHELLRTVRELDDRTQRHLILDRDNFLDPDEHPEGRANAKTLVIGAVKHGLTPLGEGEASTDGKGTLIEPFARVVRDVLAETNGGTIPADPAPEG